MVRSTENLNMNNVVKPTQEKLSSSQQNQVSNIIMKRMSQTMKAKSVNQVVWNNIKEEKKD